MAFISWLKNKKFVMLSLGAIKLLSEDFKYIYIVWLLIPLIIRQNITWQLQF